MGKVAPDPTIDMMLAYVAGSNRITVCSGSPATYTDANSTLMLASASATAGSANGYFAIANGDASGRKLTMTAVAGTSITNSGSALAVCLINTGDSTLRYVTTCTQQYLVSGGTVDIPTWKIEVADPT